MPFLYGNHVVKAHLGRITEDTPEHQGVVVYSMSDVPLVRPLFEFRKRWCHSRRGLVSLLVQRLTLERWIRHLSSCFIKRKSYNLPYQLH